MYILFSLLSSPFFLLCIQIKPSIIICNLVGYLPLILKLFNKKIKIFNSIQGYPRFSFVRKILWNLLYVKSDLLITMTELTKNKIRNQFLTLKISQKSIIQLLMTVYLRNRYYSR